MAEKSFGVKEVNLIGASGTPTITSPNNLNLNAVNVAISTNATVGGTLSVTGNVSIGGTLTYEDVTNIDSVGIMTVTGADINGDIDVDGHTNLDNVSVAGVSTFTGSSYFTNQDNYFKHDASVIRLQRSNGTQQGAITAGTSNFDIFTHSDGNGSFRIYTGNAYKLTFDSSGTLTATTFSGSGASLTSLPAANLTGTLPAISGANLTNLPADTPTNSDIQVAYTVTANGSSAYRFGGNGIVSTADNPDVYLIRGLKYRFINNSGGSHPFQIRQSSGGSAYSSGVTNNGASSGNIDFQVPYSAPSHLYYQCTSHGGMVGNLYIRGAGGQNTNVGVTTFSEKAFFRDDLTVSSSGLAVNIFESTDNHSRLRIKSADASLTQLEFADQSDADAGEIRYDHGNDRMTFHVGNNAEKMRILSTGGITFNGDSATANALDDYEEGTFSPGWFDDGGVFVSSYAVQYGQYTKIGNVVYFCFGLRINTFSRTPNTGQACRVGNLPFVSREVGDDQECVFNLYARLWGSGTPPETAWIRQSSGSGSNHVEFYMDESQTGNDHRLQGEDFSTSDTCRVVVNGFYYVS